MLHSETTFWVLIEGKFTLKLSKCSFVQRQIEYLGHIVSGEGVQPILDKVQVVQQWLMPCTTLSLRGFLGITGFYRRFIKGYVAMAAPFSNLVTREGFAWSPEAAAAFQALKDTVTNAPVLTLPDFSKPFVVETDASGSGMGAVLSQGGHPIAFFSK